MEDTLLVLYLLLNNREALEQAGVHTDCTASPEPGSYCLVVQYEKSNETSVEQNTANPEGQGPGKLVRLVAQE